MTSYGWRYESEFGARVEERYDGAVGVSTEDPSRAWARGTTVYRIVWPEAEVRTEARLDLRSDAEAYHVVVDVVAEELGSEIDSAIIRRRAALRAHDPAPVPVGAGSIRPRSIVGAGFHPARAIVAGFHPARAMRQPTA